MPQGLSRYDINDLEIVDAVELKSHGTTVIMTGVTVVSTTSATKRVVVSGVYLVNEPDERVEPIDKVVLTGTSGADGNYTVSATINDTTFEVVEAIADSVGGTAEFLHPSGSLRVGFDPTGLTHTDALNVQEAISDLDAEISAGGITEDQHKILRQLIHFVETNSPGDGFGAGPYYCETNYIGNVFPTDETWYETAAKLKKICRWECTYNVNKTFATEKWIVYKADGANPAADATDTISYTGVREDSRSRAIVVH